MEDLSYDPTDDGQEILLFAQGYLKFSDAPLTPFIFLSDKATLSIVIVLLHMLVNFNKCFNTEIYSALL